MSLFFYLSCATQAQLTGGQAASDCPHW